MKKLLAFALALAMLACVGCGGKTETSAPADGDSSAASNTTAPTEPPREKHDLGGKEFVIKTWDLTTFDYTEGESNVADAVLKSIAAVEEELNCKLKFDVVAPEAMLTEANNAILAGEKYADVLVPILWNTAGFATSGVLHDMKKIPNLDITKSYWDKEGSEVATLKGKQYFAIGPMNGAKVGGAGGVFFNKRILKECGLENPYDLVKNDQWTIDKMREMAKKATKDLNGNGMDPDDQWGFSALDDRNTFTSCILAAHGATFITKNDKGVLQYSMGLPNVTKGLKMAQEVLFKDKTVLKGQADVTDVAFKSGKALFYPFYLWKIKDFADMEDDFGIVPFPKLKSGDAYATSTEYNRSVICVPSNLDEKDLGDVGLLLDAWAFHSQPVITATHKDYLDRYLRDDESASMLDVIEKAGRTEYHQFMATAANPPVQEATYQVMWGVAGNASLNPMVEIDRVAGKGKAGIRDFMNALQ